MENIFVCFQPNGFSEDCGEMSTETSATTSSMDQSTVHPNTTDFLAPCDVGLNSALQCQISTLYSNEQEHFSSLTHSKLHYVYQVFFHVSIKCREVFQDFPRCRDVLQNFLCRVPDFSMVYQKVACMLFMCLQIHDIVN